MTGLALQHKIVSMPTWFRKIMTLLYTWAMIYTSGCNLIFLENSVWVWYGAPKVRVNLYPRTPPFCGAYFSLLLLLLLLFITLQFQA